MLWGWGSPLGFGVLGGVTEMIWGGLGGQCWGLGGQGVTVGFVGFPMGLGTLQGHGGVLGSHWGLGLGEGGGSESP